MGSPAEIYGRPVTRFAAEFIGLTNIFEGKVISTHPTRIELENKLVLNSDEANLNVGDHVEVICRPENITLLAKPSDAANTYAGRVTDFFHLGNLSETYVELNGLQIRVQSSPPVLHLEGQEIWVQMAPDRVVVLPRGKRRSGRVRRFKRAPGFESACLTSSLPMSSSSAPA